MRNLDRQYFASFVLVAVAVGQLALADPEEPAGAPAAPPSAPAPLTGPQVYNTVCIACHSPPGVGGAPALGDSAAWAPRVAQGMDTLIDHALNGFTGSTGVMPKKGQRLDLSDDEIIGAVEYMVAQVSE